MYERQHYYKGQTKGEKHWAAHFEVSIYQLRKRVEAHGTLGAWQQKIKQRAWLQDKKNRARVAPTIKSNAKYDPGNPKPLNRIGTRGIGGIWVSAIFRGLARCADTGAKLTNPIECSDCGVKDCRFYRCLEMRPEIMNEEITNRFLYAIAMQKDDITVEWELKEKGVQNDNRV